MNLKLTTFCSIAAMMITTFAFGQPSDQEVKKALSEAFAISNVMRAQHGSFLTPGEYVVVDGKLTGQEFTGTEFSVSYKGGNTGFAYADINMNQISRVVIQSPDCANESIQPNGYVIERNSEGLPIKVEDKLYSRYNNGFMKHSYLVEYANGKLLKVTCNRIMAEGKSTSSAKVVGEKQKFVTTYNWTGDGKLQVTTKTSRGINKKGDEFPPQIDIVNYIVGDNALTIEKLKSGSVNEKWEYVKKGNEIRVTKQFIVNNSSEEDILQLQDGKVVKQEHWEYLANKAFKTHYLNIFSYQLKAENFPKDNLCNYNLVTETSVYNEAGEVIEERKGGKFRRKNPDGTWGEWADFRY